MKNSVSIEALNLRWKTDFYLRERRFYSTEDIKKINKKSPESIKPHFLQKIGFVCRAGKLVEAFKLGFLLKARQQSELSYSY